jgi:hypothetical protein
MRRSISTVLFLAALCAAAPATSNAAPNWRQPFVAAADGRAPAVSVDQAGNTYVAFTAPDGLKVTRRAPGVGFDAPETVTIAAVPETQFVAGAAIGVDDTGNVTVAWLQSQGLDPVLMSSRRAAGGGWEPPQLVDADVHPGRGFALAVGANGLAAVSYASRGPDERFSVALRDPAAAGWNTPARLGTSGTADTPRVAVGADGTVAATYGLFGYGPRAFVRPAATGTWSSEIELSPTPQLHATAPSVAVDDGGGVLVSWLDATGGGDYLVATRHRQAGAATTFAAPDTLPDLEGFATGTEFFSGPALAFDVAGRATIVWRQYISAGRHDVYAAERPAGGTFGSPQALTTGTANEYMRLALDPGGTALVVWRGFDNPGSPSGSPGQETGPVFAATRASGGSFGPVTTLTPSSATTPAVDASAAGTGIAAWGRRLEGCSQIEVTLWNEGPPGPFDPLPRVCTQPGNPQPPAPAPPSGGDALPRDLAAPRASLSAASRQRALKAKVVTLRLACDEACTAAVAGRIDHKPARRQKKVRAVKLAAKRVTVQAGRSVTVRFRLSKKQLAGLTKMLTARGKATFVGTVSASDAAGNNAKATRRIALTR